MTGRPTRPGRPNPIRGPHSALTDFLASNNISAAQITADHQQRVRDAQTQAAQDAAQEAATNGNEEEVDDEEDEEYEENELSETPAEKKKRKRKEAAALEKVKKSKAFQRRKSRRTGEPDDDDEEIALGMLDEKAVPVPGQLENCEICEKRFTVTAYSKTGPDGGLLCQKCSKELADEEKKAKPKKSGPAKKGRRQNQSSVLDGIAQLGAPSLLEMCIRNVADNINDVEEFGGLPEGLLLRLSQILSKRRAISSRTLNLFLHPDLDSISIYDCGKLSEDDFKKIFAVMPGLKSINLRLAGQMKDGVLEYMIDRNMKIQHLQLDASNLISDTCWRKLFQTIGPGLESIKLSNLDYALDDDSVSELLTNGDNLRRLKLKECWKPADQSLRLIGDLPNLEHVSLDLLKVTEPESLVAMIDKCGPKLQTLSLRGFKDSGDEALDKIHEKCKNLRKLRFTENAVCTDKGFVNLFTDWDNRPLTFVDLSSTRHLDNNQPDGPEETVGLASEGFKALIKHSGRELQKLNLSSCRHISHAAFSEVFNDKTTKYLHLKELDISFHTVMDDFLVGSIFKCCPALTKLTAFACFNVRDVRVPPGVALIGGLAAQDSIVVEGNFKSVLAM